MCVCIYIYIYIYVRMYIIVILLLRRPLHFCARPSRGARPLSLLRVSLPRFVACRKIARVPRSSGPRRRRTSPKRC